MRTLVYALLLLAILHAFKPYMGDSAAQNPVSRAEVEALAAKATLISPQQLVSRFTHQEKPVLLVVYASWCTYCRQMMPLYEEALRGRPGMAESVIFLSLDKGVTDLSTYLLGYGLATMVRDPLVLNDTQGPRLSELLTPLGASYRGAIPYAAVFGAGGVLKAELSGGGSRSDVEQLFKALP